MKKRIGKLAVRYAHALLNAVTKEFGHAAGASGQTKAQEVAQLLGEFSQMVTNQREFSVAISSPMFDRDQRKKALVAIASAEGLPEVVQGFLRLLFERDRFGLLSEISHAFQQIADTAAKVVFVEITTAAPVSSEEVSSVERSLSQLIEGRARFAWSVDSQIIGGMVIRYSGKVVDGSVQGRLERLEKGLVH